MSRLHIAERLRPGVAGVAYFALVFAAGSVLGTARVLWLAPVIGVRAAELMEMPLMLAISAAAAAWLVRRLHVPPASAARLAMGAIALALVLVCEFTVVLYARGLTLQRYFATLDPVTGPLYYLLLVLFMVLPLWTGNVHYGAAHAPSQERRS